MADVAASPARSQGPGTEASALIPGRATEMPVEQRYPLDLVSRLGDVRQLYLDASADRWDPETDIDLSGLGSEATEVQRAAGALVWSHRAWLEYRGIGESEAALVRMCLERDREVDIKYLLTARGTAKALATEACWMVAEHLGGYLETPGSPVLAGLLRDRVARRGLHADVDPDAFVAAHFVLGDTIDLALWRAALDAAGTGRHDGVRGLIARLVTAKTRHAAFGWAYAEARLPRLDLDQRAAVEANLTAALARERGGLRVVAGLADRGRDRFTDDLVAAVDSTAAAGLGGADNARMAGALDEAVDEVRSGLARLGISLIEPATPSPTRPGMDPIQGPS